MDELRRFLPAASRFRFFNYAATSPMLKPSADRMAEIAQEGIEPMTLHFERWLGLLESARRTVADLIHASPEEIAFTTNTSSALSIIASSILWRPGDRVLYPAHDFPSNRYVWDNLSELGINAEAVESDFVDQVMSLDLKNVRLVAISAVSYLDGKRYDIAKLVDYCHSKGVMVAVDAVQAVGAVPVDVHKWGSDFLACGGQKWLLGPVGSGFLYINKSILPKLHVSLVGWASSNDAGDFEAQKLEFIGGARRFEPGLPDIAAVVGLATSIETLSSFGWSDIFNRIATLNHHIRSNLVNMGYSVVHCEEQSQSGIITVDFDSRDLLEQIVKECHERKIIITKRKSQLRIAAHATVSDEDVSVLLGVFQKFSNDLSRPSKAPEETSHSTSITIPESLTGRKRALITGASQGLGAAIATALAKKGYDVTILGRNRGRLTALAERLQNTYKIQARVEIVDLSNPSELEQWLTNPNLQLDYDVLVNNAASADAECFTEGEISALRNTFETNFFSPISISQKLLPKMIQKKRGAILNIVTSGARCALPLFSGYASSKGALWSWSEALARELIGTGIVVTTFIPPHMESATGRRLGRKSLAYYDVDKASSGMVKAETVAEMAIDVLEKQKTFFAPFSVRLKIAFNALFPNRIEKQLQKYWKRLRPTSHA